MEKTEYLHWNQLNYLQRKEAMNFVMRKLRYVRKDHVDPARCVGKSEPEVTRCITRYSAIRRTMKTYGLEHPPLLFKTSGKTEFIFEVDTYNDESGTRYSIISSSVIGHKKTAEFLQFVKLIRKYRVLEEIGQKNTSAYFLAEKSIKEAMAVLASVGIVRKSYIETLMKAMLDDDVFS
jgi:hypothetical protein